MPAAAMRDQEPEESIALLNEDEAHEELEKSEYLGRIAVRALMECSCRSLCQNKCTAKQMVLMGLSCGLSPHSR